jgi:putative peptide zinc metalloprotease protein
VSEVSARSGLWERLEAATSESQPAPADHDLWDRLGDMVDPGQFRPKLADDVEIKEFKLRWGNDYAMIRNPRDLLHYRLEPHEVELVRLMDGTRSVKEIVLERLQESGDLELVTVADLVRELEMGNFLERRFVDVYEATKQAMNPLSVARQKGRQFVKTLSIEWKDADRLVQWCYRHGLKYSFTIPGQVVLAGVSIVGLLAFVSIAGSGQFSLTGESLALGFLVLLALEYFSTFVHELGHALVVTHFGRRVKSAGFMIYFGSPTFFVESSDALMMERKQRIVQSAAGPYSEVFLAGITSILAWAYPDAGVSEILYRFSVLSYFVVFLNLVPFLELDGYWILSDLIQVPDLRPRSLAFIRHDLWAKLRSRAHFSLQEIGLALYSIAGFAFTVFSFYTAFFFWQAIFGDLVSQLWNGGLTTRILLLALILFLAGPVIRGAINVFRSVIRRLRALWLRIRFRLETKWRVEAAGLIDGLPLFGDLPEDVLGDFAGRVRLRTLGRGQPIFRQGDRADAFYVVRAGTLHVVEEDPKTGTERVLGVLTRGRSFGELGLMQGSARTATVRAIEESEVFEVDRGTFERLLADTAHLPDFAPTLQQAAELGELPCFSHLQADDLAKLLEHGSWVNIPPGTVLIEQGERGHEFFAIGSGRLEVLQDGAVIKTQGAGSYVGEIALLFDVPRTATVRAVTPVRTFRLDREGFERLVAGAFRRGALEAAVADRTMQH